MKFSKNSLAPLSITGSFIILSLFIPLFAVYAIFHPEELLFCLFILLLVILFVLVINIIAETVVRFRANRSSVTITLDDDGLKAEYRRKTKVKRFNVKYSDIKQIELNVGYIPNKYGRYAGKKAVEPSMELIGSDGTCLLTVSCPSLLMIYHLKKKCTHAKISRDIFFVLLLPAVLTIVFIIFFATTTE